MQITFGCFRVGTSLIVTEMSIRFSEWRIGCRHRSVTHIKFPYGYPCRNWNRKYNSTRCFEFSFWGIFPPPPDQDIFSSNFLDHYLTKNCRGPATVSFHREDILFALIYESLTSRNSKSRCFLTRMNCFLLTLNYTVGLAYVRKCILYPV